MDNSIENENEEEINKKKAFRKEFFGHISISAFLFIICIWDRIVNIPRFPKNFLFLTQIDLYINMIYYSLCIYYNLASKKGAKGKYQLLFNFNFCVSFVVFIMYWSMFIFDRETLYKKDTKLMVPTSLNMSLHGGVFFANLFEQFYFNKRNNPSYVKIWFYLAFTICYIGILYLAKMLFDIRVYPFIYGSLFKFIFICLSAFAVCLVGHCIYNFMTRESAPKSKEKNFQQFELN